MQPCRCSTIELSRTIPFLRPKASMPWKTHTAATRHPRRPATRSSPRPISGSQLRALLRSHPCPIHLVFSKGPYPSRVGSPILRGASRLDAFSVYPSRAWLPCRGIGMPTGPPAARPPRSSRTGGSPSQASCARAG